MKANELRVGNYLTDEFYEHFKTIIKVESINESGINLEIEDDGNYPECANRWIEPYYRFDILKPIPLTEDWLLKFGFNFAHSTWYVKSTYLGDISSLEYINFCIQQKKVTIDDGYDEMTLCNINYVHQLQNLYFALTGEELIINENL